MATASPSFGSLQIGDAAPDFAARSTHGDIRFHEWSAGSWTLFTTHPTPFTPVCSTELIAEARQVGRIYERGARAITLAAGPLEDQLRWMEDLENLADIRIDFPIIADTELEVANLYGLRARPESGYKLTRTAILIDPSGIIRWIVTYPPGTGRNFAEIVRVLDSLLLLTSKGLASPAEWTPGEPLLLPISMTTEDARTRFGDVEVHLPYLRTVAVGAEPETALRDGV